MKLTSLANLSWIAPNEGMDASFYRLTNAITLAKLIGMANPWLWEANIGGCERISLMFKLGLSQGPPAAASNWLKISPPAPNWPIRWPPMDAPPSSLLIYLIIMGGWCRNNWRNRRGKEIP